MIKQCKTVLGFVALAAFVLTLSASSRAWGHFLWIETPPVVQTGKKASIKIYFGEYHEGLREVRGGRLDERRGTELSVINPSGKVSGPFSSLQTNKNSFVAKFSAKTPGFYDLVATDAQSPVVDYSKYDIGVVRPIFYTRARLLSFQEGTLSERAQIPRPVLDLDIIPLTRHLDIRTGAFGPAASQEVVFRVFFKGKPFADRAEINIYAPNGWLWEGRVDIDGIGRFTPIWPGLYVIDVVYKEKVPGKFAGKVYEAVRHRATLSLVVRTAGEPE
ncbi:MAG: DUF4198 domain-containing protein [Nitrospinales bacterium]